jgi:hypothetical protein
MDVISHWHQQGILLLDPPYQRGDVWGNRRRVNLIRSIILGIPIPSIIINDRFSASWKDDESLAVIDGKQRITAILKFLNGDLRIPGEWFGMDGPVTIQDLPMPQQRRFRQTPVAFSEGCLKSIEQEQEVFDLVNFGGIPQGETDNDTTP